MSIEVTITEQRTDVDVIESVTQVSVSQESRNALYLRGLMIGDLTGITDGQAPVWDDAAEEFVPATITMAAVTSVGLSLPAGLFTVSNSPVTSTGTLTAVVPGSYGDGQYVLNLTAGVPTWASMDLSSYATKSYADAGDAAVLAAVPSAAMAFTNKTGNISQWTNNSGYALLVAPSFTAPVTITGAVGSSALTIAGATQTASFPVLDLSQTWNNAAVTFTGFKQNITNTASGALSLQMDLQVAGTSVFKVYRAGGVEASGNISALGFGGIYVLNNSGPLGFGASTDVFLYRDVAAVLAQRNGTNAQTFRLYNTYTDASNYERLSFGWASNVLVVKAEGAGTGSTQRAIAFQYPDFANDAIRIYQTSQGVIIGNVALGNNGVTKITLGNNSLFSGTSGTNVVAAVAGNYASASTSTVVAVPLSVAAVINYSNATPGAGSYEALKIAVTETALPTGTNYLIRASAGAAGSTDRFLVDNNGTMVANVVRGGVSISGNSWFNAQSDRLTVKSDIPIGWTNLSTAGANADVALYRDAAAVLALRNGTNAQAFRVYNTYTDASNYERGFFQYSSNVLQVGHEGAGTGSNTRALRLLSNSIQFSQSLAGAVATRDVSTLWLGESGNNFSVTVAGSGSPSGQVLGTVITSYSTASSLNPTHLIKYGAALTDTSGTVGMVEFRGSFAPTSTSTMASYLVKIAPTINYSAGTPGSGSYEALKIAVTETALPTGTNYLIRASAGAAGTTDRFTVTNGGKVNAGIGVTGMIYDINGEATGLARNNANQLTLVAGGGSAVRVMATQMNVGSTTLFGWTQSTDITDTIDVKLFRDAANTLALRNSTTAQTFNIYNTYTDASNYERIAHRWNTNVYEIASLAAGTGTLRGLSFGVSGNSISFYGATPVAKQTISGSRGGNAALADLLTKLASLGLVTDSTSA